MKAHGLFGVLGVACATMAFTLTAFGPWKASVSDEASSIKPAIFPPKLAVAGCEFVLKADKAAYKSGETPALEIEAVNTTAQSAEATVWVNISAADAPSPMARTIVMPRSIWSARWAVRLEPGQRKAERLSCDLALPEGKQISITVSDRDQAILASEFPVNRAATQSPVSLPAKAAQQ